MAGWDTLRELVHAEWIQRREEGCNTEGFEEKLNAAGADETKLMSVYEELTQLRISSEFPFEEPSELEEIRRLRPAAPDLARRDYSEQQWRDKFYGAWIGRSAGCALGKPLENGLFMSGSGGRPGWENVKLWFEGADAWPIQGYTPQHSRAEADYGLALSDWSKDSFRENIRFMESDDDIRYTVLGLLLLESHGHNWDSYTLGKHWHQHLTYGQVCTAETQAYLNFAQVTSHMSSHKPDDWQTKNEWVRTYLNPYREWIGAQIRADAWGCGAAGQPELAAEFAWRDASFSHVKNGIYGAMFIAAMIAAAFTETDNERIIAIGLGQIPSTCRLAADIQQAVDIARSAKDQLKLVDEIWRAFNHYHPVHTNNNAALVAASLIFAGDDFERGITTAVLGGWDTDCNGATVGSILGAKLGALHIPDRWKSPLNDTLYAQVNGFHPIAISECAGRTFEVFRKLQAAT